MRCCLHPVWRPRVYCDVWQCASCGQVRSGMEMVQSGDLERTKATVNLRRSFTIPIRTSSGLNNREHHFARYRRVKRERHTVALLWPKDAPGRPLVARLVRLKPSGPLLDSDNVVGALKGIRDEVAKQLGVDDADPSVVWEYGQEKGPWGVRVELDPLPF